MARKAYEGDEKNIKAVRCKRILELIKEQDIGTQADLANVLNKEGYNVTQATVSRDIKDLGLIKVAKKTGGYAYKTEKEDRSKSAKVRFHNIYKGAVKSIHTAMNQVVIKTDNGMASAVAAAMDQIKWDGVVGSIAGDDTILVITESVAFAEEFASELRKI